MKRTSLFTALTALLFITGCSTPENMAMQALENSPIISVNAVLKTERTVDGQSQPDTDIITTSSITVRSGAQAQCMVGEKFTIAVPMNEELTRQTGDSGVIFNVEPSMVDDTIFLKGDVQLLFPPKKQTLGEQQGTASIQETILTRFSTRIDAPGNTVELAPVTLHDGSKLIVSINAYEDSAEKRHQRQIDLQSQGIIHLTAPAQPQASK